MKLLKATYITDMAFDHLGNLIIAEMSNNSYWQQVGDIEAGDPVYYQCCKVAKKKGKKMRSRDIRVKSVLDLVQFADRYQYALRKEPRAKALLETAYYSRYLEEEMSAVRMAA